MGLKEAFAGLQTPERSDVQTPRRPSVRKPSVQTPERLDASATLPAERKNGHPEWDRTTVYIRKTTKKRAGRKWQDEDRGDFSDLVEMLLQQYAND